MGGSTKTTQARSFYKAYALEASHITGMDLRKLSKTKIKSKAKSDKLDSRYVGLGDVRLLGNHKRWAGARNHDPNAPAM